jgi:hypothetical protein
MVICRDYWRQPWLARDFDGFETDVRECLARLANSAPSLLAAAKEAARLSAIEDRVVALHGGSLPPYWDIADATAADQAALSEAKMLEAEMREEAASLREKLAKLSGTDNHPEHRCQECGGRNICWFAESPEWNRALELDGVDRRELIWCPICFARAAEAKDGTGTYDSWLLTRSDPKLAQQENAQLAWTVRELREKLVEAEREREGDKAALDWWDRQFCGDATTVVRNGEKVLAVFHRLEKCTMRSIAAQALSALTPSAAEKGEKP